MALVDDRDVRAEIQRGRAQLRNNFHQLFRLVHRKNLLGVPYGEPETVYDAFRRLRLTPPPGSPVVEFRPSPECVDPTALDMLNPSLDTGQFIGGFEL